MKLKYPFLFRSIICFFVVLSGNIVTGQEDKIEKISFHKYRYEQSEYKYKELEPFLKKSQQAYFHFKKYRSQNRISKIVGYSSLALMGTGTFIGLTGSKNNCSSGGICAHEVYGFLIGIAGIIPGTIALIMSVKSHHCKKSPLPFLIN
jgi:hypothetical protein